MTFCRLFHSLLILLSMIVEKLSESFTSPYDLMFVFFMFVNYLPF